MSKKRTKELPGHVPEVTPGLESGIHRENIRQGLRKVESFWHMSS